MQFHIEEQGKFYTNSLHYAASEVTESQKNYVGGKLHCLLG
jgi:hypothetical protein